MSGKIIILSAPSGTGKSSVISGIINDPALRLSFSISATSRAPRGSEVDGRDYYFITDEEFRRRIDAGEFVEYEEVYAGTHYGTLESEVRRVIDSGRNLILDIDVKGGLNVKRRYGAEALSIFLLPPSLEELGRRLRSRATDSEEAIARRLAKAEYELGFAGQYDLNIVNEDLAAATSEVRRAILDFIGG